MAQYTTQCKLFTITIYVLLETIFQRLYLYEIETKIEYRINQCKPRVSNIRLLISFYYFYYDLSCSNLLLTDVADFPLERLTDIDLRVVRSITAMGTRNKPPLVRLIYVMNRTWTYLNYTLAMFSIPMYVSSHCVIMVGRRFCLLVLFPWCVLVLISALVDITFYGCSKWMETNLGKSPESWGSMMGYSNEQIVHVQNYTMQDFHVIFDCSMFIPAKFRNGALRHVITVPLMMFCSGYVFMIGCKLYKKQATHQNLNY